MYKLQCFYVHFAHWLMDITITKGIIKLQLGYLIPLYFVRRTLYISSNIEFVPDAFDGFKLVVADFFT